MIKFAQIKSVIRAYGRWVGIALCASLLIAVLGAGDAWWQIWLRMTGTALITTAVVFAVIKSYIQNQMVSPKQDTLTDEKHREAERVQKTRQNYAISMLRQAGPPEARQLILDEMKTIGLLEHANLEEFDLYHMNLSNANMTGANLKTGYLLSANLRGANLMGANLENANLWGANLEDAKLWDTAFVSADLGRANLRNADLWGANLKDAFLGEADLLGAKLESALFNRNTTLPDGSKWSPDTDMKCYTDASHPDYWLTVKRPPLPQLIPNHRESGYEDELPQLSR